MSTTRIAPADITGVYGALAKRFSKKLLGRVPEPLGVYWHNRPVLQATMGLGAKAQKWDRCDLSLKSFAHMAVAAKIGCSWCLDFGYFQAFNEHLDLDKAREIPRWRESEAFTPLERDVLEYAEAMTDTPPTVDDVLVATLVDALGEAAVVELTAFIALANMNARSNVALGIESEGYAASCELKPLAQPSLRSIA
jgi:alkylhydroperoxidase family enzyme